MTGTTASRRPNGRRMTGRTGFTLIEVIAALGLSVLLMASVYGAFLLYSRVMVAGQRPIDQGQIARAVLSQLSRDLRSVVYRPPEAVAEEEGAAADESSTSMGGTGTSSSSASAESDSGASANGSSLTGGSGTSGTTGATGTTGSATAAAGSEEETAAGTGTIAPTLTSGNVSLGLVGNSTTLVLHVSRPERGLNYFVAGGATSLASRTSDLLSISYFLATRGGGGLAGTVGENETRLEIKQESDGHPIGLARLEGDRLAIEHADIESDDRAMAAAARVIAREIALLEFRYYDGAGWAAEWDTAAQGRLPHAVEVTIGFRPAPLRKKPGERSAIGIVQPITETITQVIEIPLAGSYAALQVP